MQLVPTGDDTSPFDVIRKVDDDGNEYWSARDLAKAVGYAKWDNFERAVLAARDDITALQGVSAGHANIADAGNIARVGFGDREVRDYRLTRYGAYMTLANTSKPEMKSYFVTKAREAEVMQAQPQFAVPTNFGEALELALRQWRELEAATQQIEEDAPKVTAYDAFIDTDDTMSPRDVARLLKNKGFDLSERQFTTLLREWNMIDKHGRAAKIRPVNAGHMTNRVISYEGGYRTQGRFTKKGVDYLIRKLAGGGDARHIS